MTPNRLQLGYKREACLLPLIQARRAIGGLNGNKHYWKTVSKLWSQQQHSEWALINPILPLFIHYQAPGSVVAYYQQVGRAGRALDAAYGVLLSGQEETGITDYFIDQAFPTRSEVDKVLAALQAEPAGLSIPEMMSRINLSKERLNKTIALLSLESPAPVAKQGTKWQLTAANLSEAFWQRAERLTNLRRDEQRQMQEYVRLKSGHMEFLIHALDGEPGDSSIPALPPLSTATTPTLVQEAIAFLRRTSLPIEPRKQWPAGGMPLYNLQGRIATDLQAQPGKALCIWGDAGWGGMVRQGKYQDQHFADELVDACVRLVQEWGPQPAPLWVTCIPSLRHPALVPNFARRLATALHLPFAVALHRTVARPEQKTMANSTQQARNVDGSLQVNVEQLRAAPVLLVDDMVDSRWTMTVAAYLLRSQGSGKVFPLALALTGYEK